MNIPEDFDNRILEFGYEPIRQRALDNYVSASDLCGVFGCKFKNFRKTLDPADNVTADMIEIVCGGERHKQGVWVHPRVCKMLARWTRIPELIRWVNEWVGLGVRQTTFTDGAAHDCRCSATGDRCPAMDGRGAGPGDVRYQLAETRQQLADAWSKAELAKYKYRAAHRLARTNMENVEIIAEIVRIMDGETIDPQIYKALRTYVTDMLASGPAAGPVVADQGGDAWVEYDDTCVEYGDDAAD